MVGDRHARPCWLATAMPGPGGESLLVGGLQCLRAATFPNFPNHQKYMWQTMTTMTVASRHASKPPLLQASKLQLFESQDFPRAPVDPPVYGLGATVLRVYGFFLTRCIGLAIWQSGCPPALHWSLQSGCPPALHWSLHWTLCSGIHKRLDLFQLVRESLLCILEQNLQLGIHCFVAECVHKDAFADATN